MLPTNPQSLNAADRAVLDNLKQQGEQIDRQTKVLETLIDRVTRQMRSDEKLEKIDKKNQIKGDTAVKDIPGMAFDKISDKFNDFIVNRFNSIKDKFKAEKSKPVEKQESAKKEKEPKEELVEDVLQILNVYTAKMNGLRKYNKK
jgi:predicted site-specific integrase-resolvase